MIEREEEIGQRVRGPEVAEAGRREAAHLPVGAAQALAKRRERLGAARRSEGARRGATELGDAVPRVRPQHRARRGRANRAQRFDRRFRERQRGPARQERLDRRRQRGPDRAARACAAVSPSSTSAASLDASLATTLCESFSSSTGAAAAAGALPFAFPLGAAEAGETVRDQESERGEGSGEEAHGTFARDVACPAPESDFVPLSDA